MKMARLVLCQGKYSTVQYSTVQYSTVPGPGEVLVDGGRVVGAEEYIVVGGVVLGHQTDVGDHL